jgi:hypothetical protein
MFNLLVYKIKFKILLTSNKMPKWISNSMPFLFGAILVIVLLFWIKTSNQPLIDLHSFRQCQTAITAQYFNLENLIQGFLFYETPVLGAPWKIPFEFPLYQGLASAFSRAFDIPLTTCGRILSAIFFLLILVPLFSLSRGLGFGKRFFYLSSLFLICSPFYLYWSRAFLIESTAVFLGFAFLACVERASEIMNWKWWAAALVFSIGCALVKVTTYPAFGIAAIGIIALKKFSWSKECILEKMRPLILLAGVGTLTVVCVGLWVVHTDMLKQESQIGSLLTSKNLTEWNYGSLQQKLSPRLWKEFFFDRTIPSVFGSVWFFGFFLGIVSICRGQNLAIICGMVVLYFIPPAFFTNLHFHHTYYQYANFFWLLLAFALAVATWSRLVPWPIFAALVCLVLAGQLYVFYHTNFQAMKIRESDILNVAEYIQKNSSPIESLIVVGDDWSPEIAFHAQRRALYMPGWLPLDLAKGILDNIKPENAVGNFPIKTLVFNGGSIWDRTYSPETQEIFKSFFSNMDYSKLKEIGHYKVYTLK